MVACQQALHLGDHENYARERRRESGGRGRGTWKGKLATVTHKFSFPPRNRGVGFSLVGHNWEYVYKYWRDSANDEYRRHEKLGGSGGMLPLGNFENLSSLGCNLNNLANTRISNCGQQSEKEKLDDFYYLSKKLIKLEYPRRKS